MKGKRYKIAKVVWKDAAHWRTEERIEFLVEEMCLEEVITVGFVLRESENDIVLAHETIGGEKARDVSIIPKAVIQEIKYLESEVQEIA